MPSISSSEAKKFLTSINSDDTVAIIYDSDMDGITAAIQYYLYVLKKTSCIPIPFFRSHSDVSLEKVDKCNKVIITDIAPNLANSLLEKISRKKVLYVDHHQKDVSIPKEILEYRTLSQGYIPSARTAFELTNKRKWVAVVGTITDAGYQYKENKEFINSFLKEEKISFAQFRNTVVVPLNNLLTYHNKDPMKVFNIIVDTKDFRKIKDKIAMYSEPVEEEIQKYLRVFDKEKEVVGTTIFFFFKPHFEIKRAVAYRVSLKNKNKTVVFASPLDNRRISISARNQSRKNDVAKLLKECTKGFRNAKAGGHKAAAGATILASDLEKFKARLKKNTF